MVQVNERRKTSPAGNTLLKKTALASALAVVFGVGAAYAQAEKEIAKTPEVVKPVVQPTSKPVDVAILGLTGDSKVQINNGALTIAGKPATSLSISYGTATGATPSVSNTDGTATISLSNSDNQTITFPASVNLGKDGTITVNAVGDNGDNNDHKLQLIFEATSGTPAYTGNLNVKGDGSAILFKGNVDGKLIVDSDTGNVIYAFDNDTSTVGSIETSDAGTSVGLALGDKTLNIGSVVAKGDNSENRIQISNDGILRIGDPKIANLTGTLNIDNTTAIALPTNSELLPLDNEEDQNSYEEQSVGNIFAAKVINVTGTVSNQLDPSITDTTEHYSDPQQDFFAKEISVNNVDSEEGTVNFYFEDNDNKLKQLNISNGLVSILNKVTKATTSATAAVVPPLYTTSLDIGNLTLNKTDGINSVNLSYAVDDSISNATVKATLGGTIENLGGTVNLDTKAKNISSINLMLKDGTRFTASGNGVSNIISLSNDNDSLTAVAQAPDTSATATFSATEGGANTITVAGKNVSLKGLKFTADGQIDVPPATDDDEPTSVSSSNKITVKGMSAVLDGLSFTATNGGTNTITVSQNLNSTTSSSLTFASDEQEGSKNKLNLGASVTELNASINNAGNTSIKSKSTNATLTLKQAVNTIGENAKTAFALAPISSSSSGSLTVEKGITTTKGGKTVISVGQGASATAGTYTITATPTTSNDVVTGGIIAQEGGQTQFNLGNGSNVTPTLAFSTGTKVNATGEGSANIFNLNNGDASITGFGGVTATDGASTIFNFDGAENGTQKLTLDSSVTGNVAVNLRKAGITAHLDDIRKFAPVTGASTTFRFGLDNQTLQFGDVIGSTGTLVSKGETIFNFGDDVGTATIKGGLQTEQQGTVTFNITSANADNNKFNLKFADANGNNLSVPADNNITYNLDKEGVILTLGNDDPDFPAEVTNGTFNFAKDATLTNDFAAAPAVLGTNGSVTTPAKVITFNLNGNTATLIGDNIGITKLAGDGTVDLSTGAADRSNFRLLTIGDQNVADTGVLSKNPTFKVFVNTAPVTPSLGGALIANSTMGNAYSDRIVVRNAVTGGNYVLEVPDLTALKDAKYQAGTGTETAGNVAVATIKEGLGVNLAVPQKQDVDGEVLTATVHKQATDENGKVVAGQVGDYITYFLSRATSLGLNPVYQAVYSSALQLNYDTYLANFNSLSKRLGDLRAYPQAEGAWARIFGGSQKNSADAGLRTSYKTLQAGYDRTTRLFGQANNHTGVAISYSLANAKSDAVRAISAGSPVAAQLNNAKTKAVEFAVYNSYVPAEGLYSDTIAKLSLIHSKFDVSNNASVKNYALTLSQELGYLIHLDQAQQWSLTPAYELGLGYINKSDFSQKVGNSYHSVSKDAATVLRNKLGAVLAYRFAPEQAGSVYLGAFYEHDNFFGGKVHFNTQSPVASASSISKSGLHSDGRAVLNFGVNSSLSKNIGLYLDVQKSFGGKINTDFQLNSGVRVSF